jgi:hypothetical protein
VRIAILASLVLAAALALGVTHAGDVQPGAAAQVAQNTARTFQTTDYRVAVEVVRTGIGAHGTVVVTDLSGAPATGLPVTGVFQYLGHKPGHEHNDIVVSREAPGGQYFLDLRQATEGPWLVIISLGAGKTVTDPFVLGL